MIEDYFSDLVSYQVLDDDIKSYVDYIESLHGAEIFIERTVPLDDGGELRKYDMFGTPDCVAVFEDHIYIVDYKSGYTDVSTAQNYQLLFYALSYHFKYPHVTKFTLVIHQDGNAESVTYHVEYIKEFYQLMLERLQDDTLRSGSWCTFCDRKANCSLLLQQLNELDDLMKKELSDDDIKLVLDRKLILEKFMNDVFKKAVAEFDSKPIEGYKKVPVPAHRHITPDEDVVLDMVGKYGEDVIYKKGFNTIGNLEKIMDAEDIKSFLVKPESKTFTIKKV
jgi:hypothetical protein